MHKFFVGSIILVLCTLGWIASSFGQEVPAPRGELRVVDKHPSNWASVVFNVFDHLMELNTDGTLVPRLATGWQWLDDRTLEVTLRQGCDFTMARSSMPRSSSSTGKRIPAYARRTYRVCI
jgi:hypothetical protein